MKSNMKVNTFLCLTFLLHVIGINAFNSKTPLIKNVYRNGVHFEGPHYAKDESALYWVDIVQQKILRLDIDTGNVTSRYIGNAKPRVPWPRGFTEPLQFGHVLLFVCHGYFTTRLLDYYIAILVGYGPISLVVRVKDYPKLVLVSVRSELYLLSWDAQEDDSALRLLSSVDIGLPDNRCNDGKVDAKGRLWFGTMGYENEAGVNKDQATLYMVTETNHKNPEVKVRPVSISNGIAWTSDNKFMFYIDTPTRNIDVFDFDLENGGIKNRRTLFSFQANNVTGYPDGMTIDRDGNLWVACYGGGKVIKIDSRAGKLMEQHKIPASQVTSVMWGGYDYSTLYVTTSNRGLNQVQKAKEPEAGSLFAIDYTGSSGYPENQFIFANADMY